MYRVAGCDVIVTSYDVIQNFFGEVLSRVLALIVSIIKYTSR